MTDSLSSDLASSALLYHRSPRPGKFEIVATKPLATQHDLSLAYTPGVAAACLTIAADPHAAADLTIRQNLVAVLTNGTAVLGLGNIGPLAGKPVMEGKAVLFSRRHQSRGYQGPRMFRGRAQAARTHVDSRVSR